MPIESGNYISDLNEANPTSADSVSAGDNHLRLLKTVLRNSFPKVSGAVAATHTELSYVSGLRGPIEGRFAPIDSPVFTGFVQLPPYTSIGLVGPQELAYLYGLGANVQQQLDAKATASTLGTASRYNVGTSPGQVPLIGTDGTIPGALSFPVASVMPYAGNTAPSGWLMCGGQLVSRATYAALFAIIGTTYGSGDGSTTFALPDLRGRVVAGRDNMGGNGSANRLTDKAGGLNGDILGDAGGSEVHTLVVDELPKHSHSFTYSEDQDVNAGGSSLPIKDMATTGLAKTLKTQDAGANAAHNNVQPTLILNYMIKT